MSIIGEKYFVPIGSVHRVARIVEEPAPQFERRTVALEAPSRSSAAEGVSEALAAAEFDGDSVGLAATLDEAGGSVDLESDEEDGPTLTVAEVKAEASKLGRAIAKEIGSTVPETEDEPTVVKATVRTTKAARKPRETREIPADGPTPLDPCPSIPDSNASMPNALVGRWTAKNGRCPMCGVALKADGTHRRRRSDAGLKHKPEVEAKAPPEAAE